MSRFWRTWMMGGCLAVGLFGVILAASAFEATAGPTRLLFGLLNARVGAARDPGVGEALARWRAERLSKYNIGPDRPLPALLTAAPVPSTRPATTPGVPAGM